MNSISRSARQPIAVAPAYRRIVIYGATGFGKTTLARRLGDVLGLGVIELDALFWQPDWQVTLDDEFRAKILLALEACPQGWVCDGNYRRVADLTLAQADTVIWLRLPWRTSFWRLLKRTVGRAWTRVPMWAGNTESWRQSFMSRDSILWWSISHHRSHVRNTRRRLAEMPHEARVYELRSSLEVEALVGELAGVGRATADSR